MKRKRSPSEWAFWTCLIVLPTILAVSCKQFNHISNEMCVLLDELGFSPVTEQDRRVIFEVQGTIIAVQGFGCAKRDSGGIVKVEQSLQIPTYANRATVFLNGWKLNYLSSDHHVGELGSLVGKIKLVDGKLTWNAVGTLGDVDGNDGHNSCYHYTVIAWSDAALNATVDHDEADSYCGSGTDIEDKLYVADNNGTTTAFSSFSSFILNQRFPPRATVAVLPRGFGFAWRSSDRHLLQVAYNLDHSETFVEHGRQYRKAGFKRIEAPLPSPVSRVDSGYVSWETHTVFKDNDRRRDYIFGETVSALTGGDVGIIQPPFSILPTEDGGGLQTAQGGILTKDFVIENIPFEFAVPMLTGWDLRYELDDEHITEIGIWIEDWSYEKPFGAPAGTLRYKLSSVMRDKNSKPGHAFRHKVTMLGLRPTK